MYCDVYLNRKKMGSARDKIYSIRPRTGKYQGKVRWFNSSVLLHNVRFVVNQAGRLDTLRRIKESRPGEITKTVHAMLRGELRYRGRRVKAIIKDVLSSLDSGSCQEVTYNPLKNDAFITDDGKAVEQADFAFCDKRGVYIVTDPKVVDRLIALLGI
jgi:hypothetical protein